MNALSQFLRRSPIHARVAPYVLIVLVVVLRGEFQGTFRYILYFVEMALGAWCIFEMRSLVPEMRWAFSWEAVAVGVLVLFLWVGLDPYYPQFSTGAPWNPFKEYGAGSAAAWFFIAFRTLGSAIVIPPLEEVFYRSFLYRYLVRTDFTAMPFKQVHWLSLIITSLLFGFIHYQWLAGFLCGLLYQGLVLRKNRLGDAMTAHAITNFLLGLWIVSRNAWNFW